MNDHAFGVLDSVKTAWRLVKGAKGIVLSGFVFIMIIHFGIYTLDSSHFIKDATGHMMLEWILTKFLLTVVSMMLGWSLLYIGAQRAYGRPIHFSMLKYAFNLKLAIKMFGLYMMEALVLLVPLFVMLAPSGFISSTEGKMSDTMALLMLGIICVGMLSVAYFVFRLFFAKLIVTLQKGGPISGIKQSFTLSKSNVFKLMLLSLLNIVIIVVSLLPLGLGLIWSLPYIVINYGVVYAKLAGDEGV